jgi:hypothetical protein
MKGYVYLLAAAVACGEGVQQANQPTGGVTPAVPTPDAGPASTDPAADAGSASTDPVADAGTIATTPPPADAGFATVACPGTPQLLWSRTLTTDADFRGVADPAGNLYWLEFDTPPFDGPAPTVFLVSGDGDGNVRYRMATSLTIDDTEGQFLLTAGKVIVAGLEDATISAFDAATGATAWTLSSTALGHVVDLGNGEIAFSNAAGLNVADAASGTISKTGQSADALASNGLGQFLTSGSSTFDAETFTNSSDLSIFDSSLQTVSTAKIADAQPEQQLVVAWPSASPWLESMTTSAAPRDGYLAVPWLWFSVVGGAHQGFSMDYSTSPLTVHALQDGVPTQDATFQGFNTQAEVKLFPFLSGDHLILVGSNAHPSPGLCAPATTTGSSLFRMDAATAYECPLPIAGDSPIVGAALLPGRVVIARRAVSSACTHDLQPVTLEAYALPGEALATSGWVQSGGNPGQGLRQVTP